MYLVWYKLGELDQFLMVSDLTFWRCNGWFTGIWFGTKRSSDFRKKTLLRFFCRFLIFVFVPLYQLLIMLNFLLLWRFNAYFYILYIIFGINLSLYHICTICTRYIFLDLPTEGGYIVVDGSSKRYPAPSTTGDDPVTFFWNTNGTLKP